MADPGASTVESAADAGALSILTEVLQSVARDDPVEQTLDLICRRVCELAHFDFCGVFLPDADGEHVHLAGSYNLPAEYRERLQDLLLLRTRDQVRGPMRQAVEERATVVLPDALDDENLHPLAEEFGFRSLISVPLIVDEKVLGSLNGYSSQPRRFERPQLDAVEALAGHAAISLRLTTLVEARHATIVELRQSNEKLEHQRSMLERAHQIHRRLTAAVIVGAEFQEIADALAQLITRDVAVTDATGRPLCTSTPAGDAEIGAPLTAAVAQLHAGLESGRGARPDTAIVEPIRIGAERLGYVLVPDGDPARHDLDVRAVEHAATVLALNIVQQRVARSTEERLRGDFVSDLIRGREIEDERMAERARHYGLRLDAEHRVLVLVVDDADLRGGKAVRESRSRARRAQALQIVGRRLAERAPGTLVSTAGDTVTAVAGIERVEGSAAHLREVVAAIQAEVAGAVPNMTLSAGIGGVARTAPQIGDSYRDAELCIDLVTRLDRRGDTIVRDELGVLGLFVNSDRPEELVAQAQRTLGPAIARDESREGDLVKTLDTYLDNECDLQACAGALFVHANTVKYRLRRIEELCGLNLRDPSDLLAARVATLTLKLL